MIDERTFAAICFVILVGNESHPNYLFEKLPMLQDGWGAFARLDLQNKKRVMDWLSKWGIRASEEVVQNYKDEVVAAANLGVYL